mgnify:CR=1 FL=1
MAEIKSRLAIIMKKTKKLTKAKKDQLHREDWAGKIKGWAQNI